jgi:hypothetical protein
MLPHNRTSESFFGYFTHYLHQSLYCLVMYPSRLFALAGDYIQFYQTYHAINSINLMLVELILFYLITQRQKGYTPASKELDNHAAGPRIMKITVMWRQFVIVQRSRPFSLKGS